MINFAHNGIEIEAKVKMDRFDYKDDNGIGRTRYDRNVSVKAKFWDFVIDNNLYELALVKSTLNYFMQSYWKRSTKRGPKIELATSLKHWEPYSDNDVQEILYLTAKQKKSIYTLEVSLFVSDLEWACIYLSGQEVIMLDIAISKAIALLTPETVYV